LNSDLQHLIKLQEIDLATERVRRRIAEIPDAVVALDTRLTERTAGVDSVKQRTADSQTARREIEKDLAAVQGRLSKYKGQLMEVKTNKEYQAMQHEIQSAEQHVREHEDRLLERMEEQETLAAELKQAEAALKAEQAEVSREKQAILAERGELDKMLEQKTGERSGVASKVSRQALDLFDHVALHRKGVALSEAKEGLCTQCHVRLRPQVFNEVRRNEALHQCDSCSRILYYVPTPAEAATRQQ
jgi:predicted  nucleic acid-binding Zn-ribbon protein